MHNPVFVLVLNRPLTHCILFYFFMLVCRLLIFFKINLLRNAIRMSNSLVPDQARRFVMPDLGPNCLPRFSVDDTGRQRVNSSMKHKPTARILNFQTDRTASQGKTCEPRSDCSFFQCIQFVILSASFLIISVT